MVQAAGICHAGIPKLLLLLLLDVPERTFQMLISRVLIFSTKGVRAHASIVRDVFAAGWVSKTAQAILTE